MKTNNGKVTGAKGKYYYYTDTGFAANIVVFKKTKNGEEVVGLYPFRIRQIPDPEAKVSGQKGGKIPAALIHFATSISSDTETFYFEKGLPITYFALSIVRDNKYVYQDIKNTGEQFNEEIKDALSHIEPGDSVIFKDIFATRHDHTTTILNTVSFVATN